MNLYKTINEGAKACVVSAMLALPAYTKDKNAEDYSGNQNKTDTTYSNPAKSKNEPYIDGKLKFEQQSEETKFKFCRGDYEIRSGILIYSQEMLSEERSRIREEILEKMVDKQIRREYRGKQREKLLRRGYIF